MRVKNKKQINHKSKVLYAMLLALTVPGAAQAGLVWHYEFMNNLDDSMGANDATANGAVNYIAGPMAGMQAAEFEFGSFADQQEIDLRASGDGSFTVAYWSKITRPTAYPSGPFANHRLIENGSFGNPNFALEFKSELNDVYFAGQGFNQPVDTDFATGAWKHVALVYDSSLGSNQLSYYVDGSLVNSQDATFGTGFTNSDTYFGAKLANGTAPPSDWRTAMADVREYDSALSAGDVQALTVPEPSATLLMALSGGLLAFRRRRS